MGPEVTLKIEATMSERWASQFLGMLQTMRRLGEVGSSRHLIFMADGDGDFQPKFTITGPPEDLEIVRGYDAKRVWSRGYLPLSEGDTYFDAG